MRLRPYAREFTELELKAHILYGVFTFNTNLKMKKTISSRSGFLFDILGVFSNLAEQKSNQ